MNKTQKVIDAIRALNARAKTGDKRAALELAKLRTQLSDGMRMHVVDIIGAAQATQAATEKIEELRISDDLEAAESVKVQLPPGSDDLDFKAAIQKNKWVNLASVAPWQRTNPPSVLSGTLGGQQVVHAGELIQVCNWVGDDADTTNVTITIAPVQQPPTIVDIDTLRPIARVRFGNRGYLVEAIVDVGRGCQFTVAGSAVTVEIGLEDHPGSAPGTSMALAGMLSFRQVTHSVPVTKTVYVDNVAPGVTTDLIPVPAFAQSVLPLRFQRSSDMTVLFVDRTGTTMYDVVVPANTDLLTPIPISGDVFDVQIQSVLGLEDVRLVYQLAF